MSTIFVSIASYRDAQLAKTVKSIYENADEPENLYFGIVNQEHRNKHIDFPYIPDHQMNNYKMHSKDARGAGYARKIGMSLYAGQDFYLQTDSHMRYEKGWDTDLKNMFEQCKNQEGTNKIILSQFPAPYLVLSNGKDYFPEHDDEYWSDISWTRVVNTALGYWAGERKVIEDRSKPHPSHTILAGLLFCHGSFVEEIPYDERIPFMGEELCIALRAYTRGWKIYAPNKMVAWHFYKRKEAPKIWSDGVHKARWAELEFASQKVQEKILLAEEQGTFGIGDYNKYLEYQEMIGINFKDVYEKDLKEKVNLGAIVQEIEFDENFNMVERGRSGFCINDIHDKCHSIDECVCSCHDEDREKRNARRW